ncbi:MAG TPA: hypothetical protein VGO40_20755 [Longimicrobium sp.]|nr:hypothetical protein [Longimicrobium sp.]
MDQDRTGRQDASTGRTASEDTSRAEEHLRNAEENRDALEAQNRRTEATTADETDRAIEGARPAQSVGSTPQATDTGGRMSADGPGRSTEETSEAEANVHEAERNRDALEAQNRRVERTTPADVDRP